MGFIDILVHASIFPIRFAPKIDIRKWPVLGWYLGISRPVWIDRSSPQKSADVVKQFRATMEHGIPMLVYPEGTSTSGKDGLLPFKSTPFEAVASEKQNFPILPILTFYRDGDDGQSVAWYGDMLLVPHFIRILGYKRVEADIYLLPVIIPEKRSRKELALHVHEVMEREYWRIKKERDYGAEHVADNETVMV
jgi:1-acyl-sn-glycerol-3-phosphate acyltransferase